MKEYKRTERIADLIHRELAGLIHRDVESLRRYMVSVAKVDVSPDLSQAKIYITCLLDHDDDSIQQVLCILDNENKRLRHSLGKKIQLRMLPALKFIYDDSIKQGQYITDLIDNAINQDQSDAESS